MLKFKYWIFLLTSHSLHALTTLSVTLNSDNIPGGIGEAGDLRYCLNSMNQNLNTTTDDYAITFASPMTIQLNGILPIINNSSNPVNITIGNPGSTPTVTIDGNSGAYSGFFIPMGNVTIQNMTFQNLAAKGGNGGDGISGAGGGMGAGGAIYAPQSFLNGSFSSVTLINVSINDCSAVGGNGGNYLGLSSTGNEGGGGGGGFSGNGGSITTTGSTGGGGGGGFGGDGGNVSLSTDDLLGGGGGGGGGGGAGAGAYDSGYTVQGGSGGVGGGGGGGGGGVNSSDMTPAGGGNSLGGGGGGGGGPSNGSSALGGSDIGNLGGGSGGNGASTFGVGSGGGGGGGGSGLGGAIFVDSNLNFTIQAFPGVSTTFNTSNNTTQAGTHGTGDPGGQTALMDQHWEIVYSCAQVLPLPLWQTMWMIF
jgi:hypothetical protein